MLSSLVDVLKKITAASEASVYLKNLTDVQMQVLYPLFLEAK